MDRNESYDPRLVSGLVLKPARGSLDIQVTDTPAIQVMVSGSDDDAAALKLNFADGIISMEQPAYGLSVHINANHWLQITVQLPRSWKGAVEANTISGMVKARGITGTDVKLESVTGQLQADNIEAMNLALHTTTGSIAASSLYGESLSLRSISGNVSVVNTAFRTIRLSNVSGQSELELNAPYETLEGSTISGDIRVWAPVALADARVKTVTGRIRTGNVSLSDQGPKLSLSSVSATLEINNNQNSNQEDMNHGKTE